MTSSRFLAAGWTPLHGNPCSVRILVLMGGGESERTVSLRTGAAVSQALLKSGYQVGTLELSDDLHELRAFEHGKHDVIFNCLYGRKGEDGIVQGWCEALDLRCTHSGVFGAVLASDKVLSKIVFESQSIPTPRYLGCSIDDIWEAHPMRQPYVVKPRNEGSSLGVHLIKEGMAPVGSIIDAWPYRRDVLVEEFIDGVELSVMVVDGSPLAPLSVHDAKEGIYDYASKYEKLEPRFCIPADVPEHVIASAQQHALDAHVALGLGPISGSDFIYDETNDKLYLLEVNAHPGLTKQSLLPKIAAYHGISYERLCVYLIDKALHP